jgi:hypothetical protein
MPILQGLSYLHPPRNAVFEGSAETPFTTEIRKNKPTSRIEADLTMTSIDIASVIMQTARQLFFFGFDAAIPT